MQVFLELRAVTGETVKLAAALIAILIPLYFAASAIEYLRGSASVPAISVASIFVSARPGLASHRRAGSWSDRGLLESLPCAPSFSAWT